MNRSTSAFIRVYPRLNKCPSKPSNPPSRTASRFLLLDEIVEQTENRIVCRKRFTGDEFWYAGHYPEFPLTPGVLLCEAAMQAGAVLLAKLVADDPDRVPVVTRMNNVKFKAMVRPGDTIELEVELTEQTGRRVLHERQGHRRRQDRRHVRLRLQNGAASPKIIHHGDTEARSRNRCIGTGQRNGHSEWPCDAIRICNDQLFPSLCLRASVVNPILKSPCPPISSNSPASASS